MCKWLSSFFFLIYFGEEGDEKRHDQWRGEWGPEPSAHPWRGWRGVVRGSAAHREARGWGWRGAGAAPSREQRLLQMGREGVRTPLLPSVIASLTPRPLPPPVTAASPLPAAPRLEMETGNSHQSSPASHGPEEGVWGGGGKRARGVGGCLRVTVRRGGGGRRKAGKKGVGGDGF